MCLLRSANCQFVKFLYLEKGPLYAHVGIFLEVDMLLIETYHLCAYDFKLQLEWVFETGLFSI